MMGYFDNFKVIVEIFCLDGFFCIGDIGKIDEEGML